MADMTLISQLATSILVQFEELSVADDSGCDMGYFEVEILLI
jgi:hypothetical protein